MKIAPLLLLLFSVVLADYTSYDGYTVYDVIPLTQSDSLILQELHNTEKYDFWSKSRAINHPVSIMVSPDLKQEFISIMEKYNLNYEILIENVETVFAAERHHQARAPKVAKGRISFDVFHRYDVILDYIETLAEEHPDIVTIEEYGTSYEGRPLKLLRIGNGSPEEKPTVFIEGTIHAREWIAPPVVLYIAQQIVENPEYREMAENVNWILIFVTNPDGYEYSHTNTRMWRKTRSTGIICNGADGNRNFDFQWGGPGTSTSECTETFRGRYPHSEPEVQALVDVALAEQHIDLFIAVHSYGNWMLYPWGHTTDPASNVEALHTAGSLAADAIESVNGTVYTVGSTAELLYFAAGTSTDWFKGVANATLSYTIELPRGGNQGFDIAASRIQPVITETWQGIVAFYDYLLDNSRK